jgi:glycosyltransferase involved in cell wall biosynthesis
MRLVILQFGPYAEVARRLAAGGAESFYAQKYSIDYVTKLAGRVGDLTVLHLNRDDPEERHRSGVRSLGLELYPPKRRARYFALLRELRRLAPTHLIVLSPLIPVMAWALARGIKLLPLFADSFRADGLRAKLKCALLGRILNNRRIDFVSNHNLAASLDLVRIGVSAAKVLPFDWPALFSPAQMLPKQLPPAGDLKLVYVGQVSESKGVGDIIEAVRDLRDSPVGRTWRATIVGGYDESLASRVKSLGLEGLVTFAGRLSHDDVIPFMNQHDVVVVPSRHEYPEGLPMTIYEGLCSRTPIVASDNPMFMIKMQDEQSALIFAAGNSARLAEKIRRLETDPALYARLSQGADLAATEFFCPLKYHELIDRWLGGSEEDREILSSFSIASGRYHRMVLT